MSKSNKTNLQELINLNRSAKRNPLVNEKALDKRIDKMKDILNESGYKVPNYLIKTNSSYKAKQVAFERALNTYTDKIKKKENKSVYLYDNDKTSPKVPKHVKDRYHKAIQQNEMTKLEMLKKVNESGYNEVDKNLLSGATIVNKATYERDLFLNNSLSLDNFEENAKQTKPKNIPGLIKVIEDQTKISKRIFETENSFKKAFDTDLQILVDDLSMTDTEKNILLNGLYDDLSLSHKLGLHSQISSLKQIVVSSQENSRYDLSAYERIKKLIEDEERKVYVVKEF